MENTNQRGLTVYFTDGTNMSIDFPQQTGNEAAAGLKLEDVLKSRCLLLDIEGALYVVPFENVKYLRTYPAPRNIQGRAYIKGASIR